MSLRDQYIVAKLTHTEHYVGYVLVHKDDAENTDLLRHYAESQIRRGEPVTDVTLAVDLVTQLPEDCPDFYALYGEKHPDTGENVLIRDYFKETEDLRQAITYLQQRLARLENMLAKPKST